MKNKFLIILTVIIFCSCGTSKNLGTLDYGSPSIQQELLNDDNFVITKYSTDKTYGFTEKNPVMVGSLDGGPMNERRFLNTLTGPNGEELKYSRLGSCCGFQTNNGLFGNSGMLDMYEVSYEGLPKSMVIYINMYDSDTLKVPLGLELKK